MTDLPFDIILHIGAGTGAAVSDWLAGGAQRIVLVEPNPAHIDTLNRLKARHAEVEVIEAAIAAQDGEGVLRIFNLARHSSLAKPAGLTDLLPGLRQTTLVPVTTLTPATLLARLGPLSGTMVVVVDAPGMEVQILQGLQACGALDLLDAVDLICTEDPQYQGAAGRPELQALLDQAGFILTHADRSDPDWPHLTFGIDQKARQIAALTAQLQWLADQQSAADGLARTHAEALTALHLQLQTANEVHQTVMADLDAAHAAARDLQRALTGADERTAAADQANETLRQTLEITLSETSALEARIEVLDLQRVEDEKANADLVATAERSTRMIEDTKAISLARGNRMQTLESALADRDQSLAEAVAAVADLTVARDTLTAEIAAARDTTAALAQQCQEMAASQSSLHGLYDAQTQRAIALEAAVADLTTRLAQSGVLAAEQAQGAQARQDADAATIARQTDRIKDLDLRQGLARDELRRSEGQLDLIKDLLLRGERL